MREQLISITPLCYRGTAVSMGNPHLVIFVDDVNAIDLAAVGPQLEWHPFFPGRINVEFAQLLPDGSIRMRVWERGSGITMACGTGACATAVAAVLNGHCKYTPSGITCEGNWCEDSSDDFAYENNIEIID